MSRPLVVTDCDEVVLHMVRHFRDWLDRDHDIEFRLEGNPFVQSMTRRGDAEPIGEEDVFAYLGLFFDSQMGRQTAIGGAVEAIGELQQEADVVMLTNLADHRARDRAAQLRTHGIELEVFTNQGPKGEALTRIVERFGPSRAVFIDDLAQHHRSAAQHLPEIGRLHFCGEPAIAPHVPCAFSAGDAHARIDNWAEALPWIRAYLHGEQQ